MKKLILMLCEIACTFWLFSQIGHVTLPMCAAVIGISLFSSLGAEA